MKKVTIILLLTTIFFGCDIGKNKLDHKEKIKMCKEIKNKIDNSVIDIMTERKTMQDINEDVRKITDSYNVDLDFAKSDICIGDYSIRTGKYIVD